MAKNLFPMKDLLLPPLNPLLTAKIQPRLMKDTYKKVHIYLFDFQLMLGKGSFSKVYKGINLNTNQQVAVKVVEMISITTPKLKQLLLQQIDILMKIKNQNLIKCFQVLSSAKNTYIVMELCRYDFGAICDYIQKQSQIEKSILIEKQTQFINTPVLHNNRNSQTPNNQLQNLNTREPNQKRPQVSGSESFTKSINSISSTKSVQIEQTTEQNDLQNGLCFQQVQSLKEETFYPFIKQIFEGLEYLQRQNIVHRDLKLSNIFLTASKGCKIGDFGFATIIPINQIEIKDTCCIGSPLYMSPQSYIENVYSLKSDIWSFGILLFQMIYGNPPHWNCPTHDILKSEIRKPIDLRKFQKLCTISDQLKQVLQGCLHVDVRKRFSINQLKQSKLFKRLFYQPLESKVIVSSRHKHQIDESSVEVFESSNLRNDSIKGENQEFQYNNFSAIQKVKEGSIDALGYKINRLTKTQQQHVTRKYEKNQTFNPINNDSNPFFERIENNSFTDRANVTEIKHQKRATTSTKLDNYSCKPEEFTDMKFKSTDLNGNIFKEINSMIDKKKDFSQLKPTPSKQKQFLYKNSEQMQKFLKQMKENRTISSPKNNQNLIIEEYPITFTDLSNALGHNNNFSEQKSKHQEESPKFASTFNGPFFNSGKYQKMQKCNENRKSTDLNDYNTIQNENKKLIKPSTSYSPRNNNGSYIEERASFNMNYANKENQKDQTLVSKNYSTGAFSASNKHYSIAKESQKYEYKKKMLDKCISTPKFENYQANEMKKHEEQQEKIVKHMTASTFFGSPNQVRSPKVKNPSASNIIKQFNLKEQIQSKNFASRKTDCFPAKNFQGTNNFLYQFSTKNKEPSQIQKKTYWKGNNTKNFIVGQGEKQLDVSRNQICTLTSQHANQIRNNEDNENSACKIQRLPSKEANEGDSVGLSFQSFKLLNGEMVIQDACELVNFSRLLHKLSFMTENNGNSILLLQYSIQILRNLQQKCDNFEIKYHYDSSANNSIEIREAFKSNQIYLNSLMAINQKECYAIKRENPSVYKPNSSICNKTIQLKGIIDSYIKKYLQRKEALVKLFECNILFQNLTNKVKQAKQSTHQAKGEKPALIKRSSMNCERGFLNFSRLEKVIEDMQIQFKFKKQSEKNKLSSGIKSQIPQGVGNKILLKIALFYIQAVQRCVSGHSFMRLIEFAVSIMTLSNEKVEWDFLKEKKMGEISKNRSVIERLLQGCSNDAKNSSRLSNNNESESDGFGKNYSMLITPSFK